MQHCPTLILRSSSSSKTYFFPWYEKKKNYGAILSGKQRWLWSVRNFLIVRRCQMKSGWKSWAIQIPKIWLKILALVCKHDFSKFPQWIYEFWIAHLDIIPSQIDCTNWNNLIFSREIKKSFLQPRKKAI